MAKFAREVVGPLVKEMDEISHMPASLIKDLFDHGVSTESLESSSDLAWTCIESAIFCSNARHNIVKNIIFLALFS